MAIDSPSALGVARMRTVAFSGIDVKDVDVQVQISAGLPAFTVVGLPDKAVAESRERVRSALGAMGLGLPPKRITVNLAPADLAKEGSHFDLPIALGLLVSMGALPRMRPRAIWRSASWRWMARSCAVAGVLPAAVAASARELGLICPAPCGGEAAWLGSDIEILAASSPARADQPLQRHAGAGPPVRRIVEQPAHYPELTDIKGQETAKRALEIAAAGSHNLLLIGPPGSGKSMLAARLPGLLPPLDPAEVLEVSMIACGRRAAPRRPPDRAAAVSQPAPRDLGRGDGRRRHARPSGRDLARPQGRAVPGRTAGVPPRVLELLRQPLELGRVTVARANHHVTYPARFQLVAAMNPCRCGFLDNPALACARAPRCARDYQAPDLGPAVRPHRPARRRAGAGARRDERAGAGRAARQDRGPGRRARASSRPTASPSSASPSCAPTPRSRASCSTRSRPPTPPAASCCCARPSACT